MIDINLQLRRSDFNLDAQFSVPSKGVTAVFGPSGCGKTTLLRAISGLEQAATGSLKVEKENWLDSESLTPVEQRRVAVVFQEPSLFPHLSVEQNLLYGRKRLRNLATFFELKDFYQILGVDKLLGRSPQGLSGGESQRVALGRALLSEPKLLLMDEPLSALDQSTRSQLMSFLENFFQKIDIPVFYVTHSTEEVARLADNLVLMEGGKVTNCGVIKDVLANVESFLSFEDTAFSVLEGYISNQNLDSLTTVSCGDGIQLQLPNSNEPVELGRRVRLRIQARDVSLCLEEPKDSSILNILPARITGLTARPNQGSRLVSLDVGGEQLISKVSEYSVRQLNLQKDRDVYVQIKSVALLN